MRIRFFFSFLFTKRMGPGILTERFWSQVTIRQKALIYCSEPYQWNVKGKNTVTISPPWNYWSVKLSSVMTLVIFVSPNWSFYLSPFLSSLPCPLISVKSFYKDDIVTHVWCWESVHNYSAWGWHSGPPGLPKARIFLQISNEWIIGLPQSNMLHNM